MRDFRIEANERFVETQHRQDANEERGRVIRVEAEKETLKAVRAVQWRTRFGACERALLHAKALLERLPNDEALKRECEQLEAMYKALLEEAA